MTSKNPNLKVISSSIIKYRELAFERMDDLITIEEPLEIRIVTKIANEPIEKSVAVTMRTPGNDFELVAGFLFTEGILKGPNQIKSIAHCHKKEENQNPKNIVKVILKENVQVDWSKLSRNIFTSSSCGICAKASIDLIKTAAPFQLSNKSLVINAGVIHKLPDKMNDMQAVFKHTGGIHAAGLFSLNGDLITIREDVGRHNAMDKLIGNAFLDDKLPLYEYIILLSGRASFELVQKAAMAGISVVMAVGAPSSLAIEVAKEFQMTLCGFVRNNRFSIYAGGQRIKNQL